MKDELRRILLAAGGAYGFHGDAVPVARGIPIAMADLAPDEGSVVTAKPLAPEDAAARETSQLPAVTFRLVASPESHPDDDHPDDDHADDDHADDDLHADDAAPGPAPSHADDPASAGDLSPDVTAPLGLPTAEPAGPGSVLASSPPGAKPGSRLLLRTFRGGVYEVCVPHSTCLNQFAVRLPGGSLEAGGGESFNNGSHSPLPRVLATPKPGWAIGSPLATADSHVREVVEISQDDSSSVSDLSRIHDIATWLRNTYGLRTRAARTLAVVCVQRGHDTVKALSAAPDDVLRELDCHGALPEHLGPAA